MLVNRTRWIAVTVAVAAVACADDTPAQVSSVVIAATPCDRPTARLGVVPPPMKSEIPTTPSLPVRAISAASRAGPEKPDAG